MRAVPGTLAPLRNITIALCQFLHAAHRRAPEIEASSFSGLFTLVEIGHIVIGS